ncbi:MAG: hypothetical protein H6918_10005 [Sphingomonadaceae bacterium]|nr:hypothetical protein [Sphingomonadaceae bacterium]
MAKPKKAGSESDNPEGGSTADYARAAGNLVVVDLALRAGSMILRNAVEKRVLGKDISKPAAEAVMKQSSLAGRMARVAAARLATKSVPGALIVGGGIAAKVWYDFAKKRRDERHGTPTKAAPDDNKA